MPITEDVAQMFQAIIEDRNSPKVEKSIDEVVRFLNGHYDLVLKELEEKMMAASDSLEFEKAIKRHKEQE